MPEGRDEIEYPLGGDFTVTIHSLIWIVLFRVAWAIIVDVPSDKVV